MLAPVEPAKYEPAPKGGQRVGTAPLSASSHLTGGGGATSSQTTLLLIFPPSAPENHAMWHDFKAFIMRGNVVDLAVGVIIGAAFGSIVKSLVDDVLMPPIGLATGGLDFSNLFTVLKAGAKAAPPYASLIDARAAGAVTLNYGLFINQVVTFLIVALCIFGVIRLINRLQRPTAPAPLGPTVDQRLLTEIRDLLARR